MAPQPGSEVLAKTARWISLWVIQEGLCPFAKEPWDTERVRLQATQEEALETLLLAFQHELAVIEAASSQEIETSLLVCPRAPADFLEFLDLLDLCTGLLEAQSLTDDYQLVGFHPEYCFEGNAPEDRANATNRSPYPTIQILRQESVSAVLEHHPDPSAIYERNIAHLRTMNPEKWAMLRRNNEETEDSSGSSR